MIPLFYYQNENFGDSLSLYIVERLSGEKVQYKNPLSLKGLVRHCLSFFHLILLGQYKLAARQMSYTLMPVLIAVGSLLEHSTKRCICWGTGMAQPNLVPLGGRFIMTRGLLSRNILNESGFNVESDICGDPALLMPLIYKCDDNHIESRTVGIIPHVSEVEEVRNLLNEEKGYKLIDFRTKDVDKTIRELVSCSFIYSSSLHGLILCHAYGIPCLWFQVHTFSGGNFKFNDHFSAVGIIPYRPLSIDEVNKGMRLTPCEESVSKEIIYKIQKELIARAPFPIKAKL